MAAPTVVYVHGAGAQKPARALKLEIDKSIFGRDMGATSRIAYYADVRWKKASGAGRLGAAASPRAARETAIQLAARPEVSPAAAAKAIVAARDVGAAATRRTGLAAPSTRLSARDRKAAQELVERLYRRADAIGRRSSSPRVGLDAGLRFPGLIFRLVVGAFASDVVDYLFGGYAERMREPVRRALAEVGGPRVVVAHSLGTIVAYDVLSEASFASPKVPMLVTVGSPLGLGNVQPRLRDEAGLPNPVPSAVQAWSNFADRFDPVALDASLDDAFTPEDLVKDEAVNNGAGNNHDLAGYLDVEIVRETIRHAARAT